MLAHLQDKRKPCPGTPNNWEKVTRVQLDPYLAGMADTQEYEFKYRTLRIMHTK
jgi:hypothetical protein